MSVKNAAAKTKTPAVGAGAVKATSRNTRMSTKRTADKQDNVAPLFAARGHGAWLESRLNRMRRDGVFTEIVDVSPELATEILAQNPDNRAVVVSHVRRLSGAMARGEWEMNGETIIISEDGLLNDGQHRLMACVESGTTFRTIITFGVSRISRESVDQGTKRSAGGVLQMAGIPSGNLVATSIKFILNYEEGVHLNTPRTTKEIQAALERHPNIAASQTKGRNVNKSFRGSAGGWVGLHYLMSQQNAKKADEFFEILATGVGVTTKTNPVGLLRSRLIDDKNGKAKLPWTEIAALAIKAWNAFKANRPMATLRWSSEGKNTEAFPRIM